MRGTHTFGLNIYRRGDGGWDVSTQYGEDTAINKIQTLISFTYFYFLYLTSNVSNVST